MNLDDKWQDFAKTIMDIQKLANHLPSPYDLDYLLKVISALIDKYALLKVGDRAEIINPPACEGGWKGSEHCLCKGALGNIVGRDFSIEHNCFMYEFEPDDSDLYVIDRILLPSGAKVESIALRRDHLGVYMLGEHRLAKTTMLGPRSNGAAILIQSTVRITISVIALQATLGLTSQALTFGAKTLNRRSAQCVANESARDYACA